MRGPTEKLDYESPQVGVKRMARSVSLARDSLLLALFGPALSRFFTLPYLSFQLSLVLELVILATSVGFSIAALRVARRRRESGAFLLCLLAWSFSLFWLGTLYIEVKYGGVP